MIRKLKTLFASLEQAPSNPKTRAEELNLCSFALMSIVAQIDSHFAEEEKEEIIKIGRDQLSVDAAQAKALLEDAKQHAKDSTSLYEYTEIIHRHFDEPSKFQLISNLWKIAIADGNIDRYEEHIIRRVADLIYLDHHRFIEAKLKALES